MADGFVPPAAVRSNARRGLELRKKYNRGGTEVGVARARDLSNGAALSLSTIKRMNSFFSRHEVDKKGEGWGKDSAGYIAWLLWGGDAGWSWAKRIIREQENKEKSQMTDLATSFFAIEKADRNADGTLMVFGKATDDSVDIDQQICDSTWLDRAMPDWFKTGGNIREQHSAIAAGVAKEYEQKKDGHYIRALVVDPISVRKVETGVLKGFSIGIKNPRVVRDTKAANGRIIDGQIVEVSLVDRPANPNCQLVLAKSAAGDSLVQVEDLIEKAEEKPNYGSMIKPRKGEPADKDLYNRVVSEAKDKFDVYPSAVANAWVVREYKKRGGKYKTESKEKAIQSEHYAIGKDLMNEAQEIIELSKSYRGNELLKFDKKTYDMARQALADLIAIEAKEMSEGHNEEMSLSHLLSAVHHLFAWYEGEEAEGEVMEETEIELAAKKDEKPEVKELMPEKGESRKDFMKRCKDAGMDDDMADKCWSKYMKEADKSMHEDKEDKKDKKEKSADTEKCLECGCHKVESDHGRDDVTTAEIVTPDETPKSADADTEVSADKADIEAMIEQVVKSATESLREEIAGLVSAKKAADEKAVSLESELAAAKSLAVAGGPKRTGKSVGQANDFISKAAIYNAKAKATTDPTLAKGYKALADEYYSKANAETQAN